MASAWWVLTTRASGLIIIGRRQEYSARYNEFRRQKVDRERIVIHSYDWLLDVAQSNNSGWLTSELVLIYSRCAASIFFVIYTGVP